MVDAEGNALSQVWFVGVASMLALRTTFAVDTLQTNPFDYIVLDPDSLRVPMTYDEADRRALVHYLDPPDDPEVEVGVRVPRGQADGLPVGGLGPGPVAAAEQDVSQPHALI